MSENNQLLKSRKNLQNIFTYLNSEDICDILEEQYYELLDKIDDKNIKILHKLEMEICEVENYEYYILGFLLYRYISEKQSKSIFEELKKGNINLSKDMSEILIGDILKEYTNEDFEEVFGKSEDELNLLEILKKEILLDRITIEQLIESDISSDEKKYITNIILERIRNSSKISYFDNIILIELMGEKFRHMLFYEDLFDLIVKKICETTQIKERYDKHEAYKQILKSLEKTRKYIQKEIKNNENKKLFQEIFNNINLEPISPHQFPSTEKFFKQIANIIINISKLEFKDEKEFKNLFEHLILKYGEDTQNIDEEIPEEVSQLLIQLTNNTQINNPIKTVYNPTSGASAKLLYEIANTIPTINSLYGEEINQKNTHLAFMNMVINDIPPRNFIIKNINPLKHILNNKFDLVISKIPQDEIWNRNKKYEQDPRFNNYSTLPPQSRSYYAYLQNMIYTTKDDGISIALLTDEILKNKTPGEKKTNKRFYNSI